MSAASGAPPSSRPARRRLRARASGPRSSSSSQPPGKGRRERRGKARPRGATGLRRGRPARSASPAARPRARNRRAIRRPARQRMPPASARGWRAHSGREEHGHAGQEGRCERPVDASEVEDVDSAESVEYERLAYPVERGIVGIELARESSRSPCRGLRRSRGSWPSVATGSRHRRATRRSAPRSARGARPEPDGENREPSHSDASATARVSRGTPHSRCGRGLVRAARRRRDRQRRDARPRSEIGGDACEKP